MLLPTQLIKYCEGTKIAISIAQSDNDQPLIYVNKSFETLTGYHGEELYGDNCRVLQKSIPNRKNRQKIRDFIKDSATSNIRVPLINFKKDGTPFVNLLFMSKLKNNFDDTKYLFASQFDISHTYPDVLAVYEHTLETTLTEIPKTLGSNKIILSGSLSVVANAAATIAQAKIMLDQIDASYL